MLESILFFGVILALVFVVVAVVFIFVHGNKPEKPSENKERVDYIVELINNGDLKAFDTEEDNRRWVLIDLSNADMHLRVAQKLAYRKDSYNTYKPTFKGDLSSSNNTALTLGSENFFLNLSDAEITQIQNAIKNFGHGKLDEKLSEYRISKARKLISDLESNSIMTKRKTENA